MFRRISCFIFFRIMRWKIQGNFPADLNKYVVAAAPHTSSWDFPIGLMLRSILRFTDINFVGKASLFKPPFGWIFKKLGGYPVDRSKRSNFVDNVIDIFNREPVLKLTLAPEGTRKRVEKLRTGFYYIAKGAGVPIVMVQFDYGNKRIVISPPFYPGDDPAADLEYIASYFRGVKGFYPERSFY